MVGFISTNITFEDTQNIHFTFCLNLRLFSATLAYQVSAREVCVCCSVKLTQSDLLKKVLKRFRNLCSFFFVVRGRTLFGNEVCVFLAVRMLIYTSLSDLNIGDEREINPDQ